MLTSLLRLLLVVVYTLLLAVLATIPPIRMPVPPIGPMFKWHHFSAFAVYVFLLGSLLDLSPRFRPWLRYLVTGLIAFTFGAVIELIQRELPYRSGQWIDLIPNTLGIIVGFVALAGWEGLVRRWRRVRRSSAANEAVQDQTGPSGTEQTDKVSET